LSEQCAVSKVTSVRSAVFLPEHWSTIALLLVYGLLSCW